MSFYLLLLYLIALYVRWGEQFPSLAPYPIMYFLGLAATTTSVMEMLAGKRPTFRAPQIYLMVGLTGMVAFSIAATGWFGGALIAFMDFSATATVFLLIVFNVTSMRRMRTVVVLLVGLTLFITAQGVLGYHLNYGGDKFVYWQRIDASQVEVTEGQRLSASGNSVLLPRIRSLGFLNDPNDLAQAILITIPFLFLAWRRRNWLRNAVIVGVPLGFLIYGMYLTRSRGGILGLLVLALLALRWRLGRTAALVLTATLGLALLGLNFTGGRGLSDASSVNRVDAWSEGLQFLKTSPVWGVGYRQFSDLNDITAHNSLVLCFAELGLVGYFFWLSLLVITLLELNSLGEVDEEPEDDGIQRWARAIFLALCVFLAAALFLSRTYIVTLYILLGLGTALVDIARRHEIPVFELSPLRWVTRVGALEFASIIAVYVVVRFA